MIIMQIKYTNNPVKTVTMLTVNTHVGGDRDIGGDEGSFISGNSGVMVPSEPAHITHCMSHLYTYKVIHTIQFSPVKSW